jgi:hypothetical protein
VIGEKQEKVLAVPVESVFKRDEQEIVFVKKAIDPKALAEQPKKKEGDEAKKDDKDAWKQFFDKRVVVTGLADNARVQIVSGLKAGEEVALEDPTLPKVTDDDED